MNLRIYNIFLKTLKEPDKYEETVKDLSKEELYICSKHIQEIDRIVSSEKPDYDKIWNNIEKKIPSRWGKSFLQCWRYVASIALIVGLSYLSFRMYNTFTTQKPLAKKINKEKPISSPKIVLSGGEVINLSREDLGTLLSSNNVTIKKTQKNTVTYNVNTDKIEANKYNTIIVPKGSEYSIVLSDGTFVQLNSESKLRYPVRFLNNTRKVFLEGEGFFRVKKNEKKSFVVVIGDTKVKVLGTTFNVNAYKENLGVATTLVEGKVEVFHKESKILLKPNQQAMVTSNGIYLKNVDAGDYVSWINGVFCFNDIKLEKLMIQIERWYNVNVFFMDQKSKEITFTGGLKKELSIEDALEIISRISKLRIRLKNGNVYVKK